MEQFEGYFRRADLDGDGKISGAEAVSFFQGSNLPKTVLAQIWTYADERRSGFLGRSEFYNALKLVTVAQSKRDLTPDIVKAALYGPAAAKIPPPHINLSAIPPPNPVNPIPLMAGPTQNLAFRGPGISNPSIQYFQNRPGTPSQSTVRQSPGIPTTLGGLPTATAPQVMAHTVAQSQATIHPGTASRAQSMPTAPPGIPTSNIKISNDWLGGHGSNAPRGISSSTVNASPQPLGPIASHANTTVVSGNDLAGYSNFGSNATSAALNAPSWLGTPATSSTSPPPPASHVTQSPAKSSSANSLDSLQSAFAMQPLGSSQPPPPRPQSLPKLNQQATAPSSSSPLVASGVSDGSTNASDNNQIPWPKMKPSDIQKYNKVFMEVDTDRDGKITGEQARNLFLSWRLPREVLKQVWDLSDQDSDSMLSVREFCFALYLMERYREGRPLPSALPSSIIYDETLLSMTGQPRVVYGNASWGPSTGFGHRPVAPNSGLRPPVPSPQSGPAATKSANQPKSGEPLLEDSFLDQRDTGDHNSINQDLAAEKKVSDTAKVILDSREKIEYYRSTMQELVLYKSRCDNKLNEITERALADKREAELLSKKYEEKYKQVAEVASKLTIEEATFRDIQERKMELNQAIVNVEQGGSADGLLQVRADRIQSHLDELTKALTERSKKHGIDIKSATMIELPIGWQPGIQEGAAVWDEDWDKFEDEGFSSDLVLDAKNNPASEKPVQNGKAHVDGSSTPDSLSNGSGKLGQHFSDNEHVLDSESAYAHSEDELVRSPQDNPAGRTSMESASQDFSDVFAKTTESDAEPHRSFDDSTWGAFDTSDDVDSVWGFNPGSSKDVGSERQNDLFGTDDFGLQPIRTESPTASDFRKKSVFFEDSVPGTPASRFSNSPRYSEAGDPYDRISGFDSFGMHEGGFSPKGKKLTRFDSASSTKDFGQSDAFSSFDDSDPFGSSGPFRVSSDDRTSKKASENWGSSF